jgi:3',5'-cyclic-nucleotide phosphodiesterase
MVQIHNGYRREVHYHNDLHGSDVAQHCNFILKTQNLGKYVEFNKLDTLSVLVAALCHDVDHDGFNNSYHLNTKSPHYQKYGEQQIQENNHVA